jgi:hypothetical protein
MPTVFIVIQQNDNPGRNPGTRDNLLLNVPIVLSNLNDNGILTWFWHFTDLPSGSNATLSAPTTPISGFTPDVPGTYLIRLTVGYPGGSQYSQVGAAIETLNLHYRIPAATEDDEFDSVRGWSQAVNEALQVLDDGYGNLLNGVTSAGSALPPLANVEGAVLRETEPGAATHFQRLSYDDIDPPFAITSFSGPGSVEFGTVINNPHFTASYNAAIASATINDGPLAIAIALPATSFAYGSGGLPAKTYQAVAVNSTQSWTLSATKSPSGPVKTAVRSINMGETRIYYGTASVPGIYDQGFIKSLGTNYLASNFAGTYVFAAPGAPSNRIYLCWPAAFGNPSSILGPAPFPFLMHKANNVPVPFTNNVGSGFAIPGGYDIWESNNDITSAFTIVVS